MKKFNLEIIEKLIADDDWGLIHRTYDLPLDFIEEHINEINWSQCCWFNLYDFDKISDEFLQKYSKKMLYTMRLWVRKSHYEERQRDFEKFLKGKNLIVPPKYFSEL